MCHIELVRSHRHEQPVTQAMEDRLNEFNLPFDVSELHLLAVIWPAAAEPLNPMNPVWTNESITTGNHNYQRRLQR